MAKEPPAISMSDFLRCIRERPDKATAIAKAAEIFAGEGNSDRAIGIVRNVEQLIHEVTTFLNAASFLHRCADS